MSTPNADSCPRLRRQLGTLAGLADQQLKKWEISFRGRHRSRPDTICAGPESAKCPRLWDFYFVLKEPHPYSLWDSSGNFSQRSKDAAYPAAAGRAETAVELALKRLAMR